MADSSPTKQVEDWVVKVFAVCGIAQPPKHVVAHYTKELVDQNLTYQVIVSFIYSISSYS